MRNKKNILKTAVELSEEILRRVGPCPAITICARLKEDYGSPYDNISSKELSRAISTSKHTAIKRRAVEKERGFSIGSESRDTLIYYVGRNKNAMSKMRKANDEEEIYYTIRGEEI